jgi:hypothetical protein
VSEKLRRYIAQPGEPTTALESLADQLLRSMIADVGAFVGAAGTPAPAYDQIYTITNRRDGAELHIRAVLQPSLPVGPEPRAAGAAFEVLLGFADEPVYPEA